jgi:hypothetical protein
MDSSETFHINYLVIKTYKLAEQTGSYLPNPTREVILPQIIVHIV